MTRKTQSIQQVPERVVKAIVVHRSVALLDGLMTTTITARSNIKIELQTNGGATVRLTSGGLLYEVEVLPSNLAAVHYEPREAHEA